MIAIRSHSAEETKRLGANLARLVKAGGVIALTGDLGSGKTVFVQGLTRGLGIKQKITSPTFVVVAAYRRSEGKGSFYHLDLYRVSKAQEWEELGLREILQTPHNIVAIEWAEKAKRLLPPHTIHLNFSAGRNPRERLIKLW